MTTIKFWIRDIFEAVTAPDGWKLVAKTFTFMVALFAACIALSSLRSHEVIEERSNSDAEFQKHQNLIFSENAFERSIGLQTFDRFFSLKTPKHLRDQNLFNITFGPLAFERPYTQLARNTLLTHLNRLQQGISASGISVEEFSSTLRLIERIGCGGWNGEVSTHSDQLQWIWNSPANRDFIHSELGGQHQYCGNAENSNSSKDQRVQSQLSSCQISYDQNLADVFAKKVVRDLELHQKALIKSNFNESTILGVTFLGANLAGASFKSSEFLAAEFSRSRLVQTNFARSKGTLRLSESELCDSSFSEAQLDHLTIRGSAIVGTDPASGSPFANSKMLQARGLDMTGSSISSLQVYNADMSSGSFQRAVFGSGNVSQTLFVDSVFEFVEARGLEFFCVDLTSASAWNAAFDDSIVKFVSFSEADLINASFRNATIESTNFSGAQLKGADFTGAQINWKTVDFSGARDINLAVGLDSTKFESLNGKSVVEQGCSWQ